MQHNNLQRRDVKGENQNTNIPTSELWCEMIRNDAKCSMAIVTNMSNWILYIDNWPVDYFVLICMHSHHFAPYLARDVDLSTPLVAFCFCTQFSDFWHDILRRTDSHGYYNFNNANLIKDRNYRKSSWCARNDYSKMPCLNPFKLIQKMQQN